jgi:hypothetical protein
MATARWGGLRLEPYNPDAVDADGDGIVQEGTAWERPAGTRLISELGTEIQRGFQSLQRPRMRVVDSRGNTVDYKASYERSTSGTSLGQQQKLSLLGSLGYPSLKERGIRTIGDMVPTVGDIVRPKPKVIDVEGAIFSLKRRIAGEKVIPKRGNRARAFGRSDEKAKELAFMQGPHYLIETDNEFLVLSVGEFDSLFAEINGPDGMPSGISVTKYERPRADQADQQAIKDSLFGPRRMEIDDTKYRDAVVDIHHNSGSIDDLDDDLFVAAMLDEGLEMGGSELLNSDGSQATFEDILDGERQLNYGEVIENRRFTFEQLKSEFQQSDSYGGLWTVLKVKDKETGDTWYVKGSTYPVNDAVLEEIGMRVGALLDLAAKPDQRHIRITPQAEVRRAGLRTVRWTAMRDVKEWEHPDGDVLAWADSGSAGGIDPDNVDVNDVAQILVMDFIFGNSDRHDGNFMVATDSSGRQRLMIIDNGLLAGGRMNSERADYSYDVSTRDVVEYLEAEADRPSDEVLRDTSGNHLIQNPKIKALDSRLGDADGDGGEFISTTERTVQAIKENLDFIFDSRKFSQRGVPLTATERAHLDGLRKVAERRIEMLESNSELLWYEVFEPIPGLVQAPGANTPESEVDIDLPDEIKEIPTNDLISEKIKARNKEILDGIREAGGTDFARPTPEFLDEINEGRTYSQRGFDDPEPGYESHIFPAIPRQSKDDAAESRRERTNLFLTSLKQVLEEYGDEEPDWETSKYSGRRGSITPRQSKYGMQPSDWQAVQQGSPELLAMIKEKSVDELLEIIEERAAEFIDPDLEIRVRTDAERLEGILKDGRFRTVFEVESRVINGVRVSAPTESRIFLEERLGISADTPPELRPASGYIVHPDWSAKAVEDFKSAHEGREPTEHDELPLLAGKLSGYGEVEIKLRPEVKGRSSFGRGDSFNGQVDQVRFDETDPAAIANALITGQGRDAEELNISAIRMLESAAIGDFSDINVVSRSPGEGFDQSDVYFEALIPGGFTLEEIEEVVMPIRIATEFDMDAVSKDLTAEFFATDKLRSMGLSEEEVAYVLQKMSETEFGRSPIANVSTAWVSRVLKVQEFRAARARRDALAEAGIPLRVKDPGSRRKSGIDIFDPVAYGGKPDDDVEKILIDRAEKDIVTQVRASMDRELNPPDPSDRLPG